VFAVMEGFSLMGAGLGFSTLVGLGSSKSESRLLNMFFLGAAGFVYACLAGFFKSKSMISSSRSSKSLPCLLTTLVDVCLGGALGYFFVIFLG
jgi:hypothetical protein